MDDKLKQFIEATEASPELFRLLQDWYTTGSGRPSAKEIFERFQKEERLNLERISPQEEQVQDIRLLQYADNLKELSLRNHVISDIGPLVHLRQLTHLNLSRNSLRNIRALAECPSLKSVELGENWIEDFTPLERCHALESLGIVGNFRTYETQQVYHLSRVANFPLLPRLTILTLSYTALQSHSLDGLEHLPALQTLQVSHCSLQDISSLQGCHELLYLDVSQNDIHDISALRDCPKLTYLNIEKNSITDLSPLANLQELRAIHLGENPLTSIVTLKTLPKLWEVFIDIDRQDSKQQLTQEVAELTDVLYDRHDDFWSNTPHEQASLNIIADDMAWNAYERQPFNVADYSGNHYLLSAEHGFLTEKLEEALAHVLDPDEMLAIELSSIHGGISRTKELSLVDEDGVLRKFQQLIVTIQKVLCHMNNEWRILLLCEGDDFEVTVGISRRNVITREMNETLLYEWLAYSKQELID